VVTLISEGALDASPRSKLFLPAFAHAHVALSDHARGKLTLELRTNPDTMEPSSLVVVREVTARDASGVERRGRIEQRRTYRAAPADTPVWRPLH
jgi:hypothetical protein